MLLRSFSVPAASIAKIAMSFSTPLFQAGGTFPGDHRVREELAACAAWPRYHLREGFFDPPKTSPPLLVISGEMDNVAAPEWGYRFCSALPACRFVSIPQMGHGPFDLDAWTNGTCFDKIADGSMPFRDRHDR